jgi:hypothetical protein
MHKAFHVISFLSLPRLTVNPSEPSFAIITPSYFSINEILGHGLQVYIDPTTPLHHSSPH